MRLIFCTPAPNPVDSPHGLRYIAVTTLALVAELVDALVSGTSLARGGGSSPLLGTIAFMIKTSCDDLAGPGV